MLPNSPSSSIVLSTNCSQELYLAYVKLTRKILKEIEIRFLK